ncbi:MAG: glycoside hydrolase family 5 protein, partial [Myxococcota bacterium]|nr:glycoside hydrolase family 5 protein [Myxococcota bacterium]
TTQDSGVAHPDTGTSPAPRDAGSTPDAGGPTTPAPYHVQGAQILDKDGRPHLFRGLNRPSLEWSCSGDIVETDFQTMAQVWHANTVRLPLNQDCWIKDASNPSYDPSYQAVVDEQVRLAKKYNMDIVLDLHWSDRGDYAVGASCLRASSSSCQQDMADAHSVMFWQQVAARYKNEPQVIFDLYNEPSIGGYMPGAGNWDTWLNGGTSSGFAVHGMQELYSAVRMTGANNLVLIGGLNWAFDLSGVASHKVAGTNIVYSVHVYQQNPENMWSTSFGNLAATAPVFASEFGDRSGSCSTALASDLTRYANGNAVGGSSAPANKLSWTAWAFYAPPQQAPCTVPALVNSDWVTPNAMGQVVKDALIAGP